MNQAMRNRVIEAALQQITSATGVLTNPKSSTRVAGGCIHEALHLKTDQGDFFIKFGPSDNALMMLQAESRGLEFLSRGPVKVPKVIGCGKVGGDTNDDSPGFLVMEWIEPSAPSIQSNSWWERFGHDLAELHSSVTHKKIGFEHDNWIGSTPQINTWSDSWVEFWRHQRLEFQLDLARDNALLDDEMIRRGSLLIAKLNTVLAEPSDAAGLLHGDLWSGNFLCGTNNELVLIDPAPYFGNPEAEFGMISLFGGFDRRFFDAYHEIRPNDGGFAERIEIYKLYHLLNHLNLFGTSYRKSCVDILRRFT